MQLWTSGEVNFDVAEAYSSARIILEREVNAVIASTVYGPSVTKWALIFIILPDDDSNYPEVQRYRKRTGVVEFRLKIDHSAFMRGSATEQFALLASSLLRSVDLARNLKLPEFNGEQFKLDVLHALSHHDLPSDSK